MILAALLAAAAPAAPGLDALPRQELPARGCAAFLWTQTGGNLVAMAGSDPALLRLMIDGRPFDLPRTAAASANAFGFAAHQDYAAADTAASLDLTVVERQGLTEGAAIPTATLTVARRGRDTIVVPALGLIGCAPT